MNVGKIIVVILCAGVIAFLAACCGGNAWTTTKFDTTGLWKICSKQLDICKSFSDLPVVITNKLKAERAFAILSVLAAAAGGLLALLRVVTENIKGFMVSIFVIVSALSMIISLGIFTKDYIDQADTPDAKIVDLSLGWSYILGWLGVAGCFGIAVISVLVK